MMHGQPNIKNVRQMFAYLDTARFHSDTFLLTY